MGLNDDVLQSEFTVALGGIEASFGDDQVKPAAGDSFKQLGGAGFTHGQDNQSRDDMRTSAQDIDVYLRNLNTSFTCRRTFNPRGGTTPPDDAFLWEAGLGQETVGGSDVTYDHAKARKSVWLMFTDGDASGAAEQEKGVGCLVEETKINLVQGEEPTVESTGPVKRHVTAGQGNIAAGGATSATQTLDAGDVRRIEKGAIVEVDGVATDLLVTAQDIANDQLTFDSSITTTGAEAVRPYSVWSDSTTNQGGKAIASFDGTYTIGGATYGLVGAAITIKNNWVMKRILGNKEFADAAPGRQKVTGTLTFDAYETDLRLLHLARQDLQSTAGAINPMAVVFTLGNSTDGQCVITMPKVVLLRTSLQHGESGLATFELPFIALSTLSSGVPQNDAIKAVWS